jgi:hypothetical protein
MLATFGGGGGGGGGCCIVGTEWMFVMWLALPRVGVVVCVKGWLREVGSEGEIKILCGRLNANATKQTFAKQKSLGGKPHQEVLQTITFHQTRSGLPKLLPLVMFSCSA